MGRDKQYAADMTPEIEANGADTVAKLNLFMARYVQDTGDTRRRKVNSGWRPPAVNKATKNAAPTSKHMRALAGDLEDFDDGVFGSLDDWCFTPQGEAALVEIGLWHEHPLYSDDSPATPGWCHLQTVAPGSGKRHFHAK